MVQYFDDAARYADLLNGYVFHGQQIVKMEDVQEMDSRKLRKEKRPGKRRRRKFRQRYQDMVRKIVCGINCVVIDIENQSLVHYAMPIRVMSGDSMEYDRQLRLIQQQHRKDRDLKDEGEYLGAFSARDKLVPAFSLVVYYGKEPWDGARDVFELLDFTDIPNEMKKLVNHYPIHILEVRRFADTELFKTDLREVFEFIQCSDNKEKMADFMELRKEQLSGMADDACDLIMAVTGLQEISLKKEVYRNGGGSMNMCKAFEDWSVELRAAGRLQGHQEGREEGRQEGREEGRQEGLIEGHKEGRMEALKNAAANLFQRGMTIEEVSDIVERGHDEVRSWYEAWSAGA